MRYAVYYTPDRDTDLSAAAAAWLGRDLYGGGECPQPELAWLPAEEQRALTADPRRYGFHATLKAPFRLKQGTDVDALFTEADRFAGETAPVTLSRGLTISRLGPFFALVPAVSHPTLDRFAGDCIRAFEPYRAPLSEEELARRRQAGLTGKQDAQLLRWGYPYVFDDFRFHMTLTGRVPEARRAAMQEELEARFAVFTGIAHQIDRIALFSQQHPQESFKVEAVFPLNGSSKGTF